MPRVPYDVHRAQKEAARALMDGRAGRRSSFVESETDYDAESIFSNTTYQSSSFSPYPHSRALQPSSSHHASSGYHPYAHAHQHPQVYRSISSTSYGSSYPPTPGNAEPPRNAAERSVSPSPLGYGYGQDSLGLSAKLRGGRSSFSAFPPTQVSVSDEKHLGPTDNLIPDISVQSSASGSAAASSSKLSHLARPSDRDAHRAERRARRRAERQERSTLSAARYDSPLRRWVRFMGAVGWGKATLPLGLLSVAIVKAGWWLINAHQDRASLGDASTAATGTSSGARAYGFGEKAGTVHGWKQTLVGELLWALAVVQWVVREGRKGGRSWRSQVIGILAVLLSPLSLLAGAQTLFISLALISLNLLSLGSTNVRPLSAGSDHLAAVLLTLAARGTAGSSWPYVLGFGGYAAGRAIWLGGRTGVLYFSSFWVLAIALISISPIVCRLSHSPYFATFAHTISRPLPIAWRETAVGAWTYLTTSPGVDKVFALGTCGATGWLRPSFWFQFGDAWAYLLQHKLRCMTALLASLPPLSILTYSNLSLRSTSSISRPSPTIHLLPLILFLLSVPAYIFAPSPEHLALVLMPITLLMALRGGAGRGSELGGGGAEEEVWMVGLGVNLLGVIGLIPLSSGLVAVASSTILAVIWTTLSGASWICLVPLLLRLTYRLLLPLAAPYIHKDILASTEIPILRTTLAALWLWGMKKLIQSAWAMGGLSGTRSVRERAKVS